jgi:hypothetical protein
MAGTRRNAGQNQAKGEAAAAAPGSQPARQRQEPSQLLQQYRTEWQERKGVSGKLLM